ncbi:MAG: peptide ABC transporter substrate-binding protein [Dehalococcoidia bacterium]|nr:peptide ABC transporter substrate-binding protein [Dehalococcoidia bacterium]
MKVTPRSLLVPAAAVMVALIAAACGRGGGEVNVYTSFQETLPAPTTAPHVAAPSPAPAPATTLKEGGVFRRLWTDPPTLDPHLANDTTSAGLIVEIFSGLLTITPDLGIAPDLAERMPDVSQDRLTYTFTLRQDAKFQDGRPITADDFKYSIERATDPSLLSPVADTYLGEIVGVKEKLKRQASEVSGVKVIDDRTIQITTVRPSAYFLAMLTYPTAYFVDRNNIEELGRNWTSKPNGTGPFKLREYRIGERLVLERNPHYYRGPARLERIEYILSGGAAMAMYENDEIDITSVGIADLDRVRDLNDPLNKDLNIAPPGFDISYVGFNASIPPFDDPKVRQALNLAINKELLATEVLANLVIPAYGILPPEFPGYSPNVQGLRFDAERARQLLAESTYANNMPRIVLTVPGTGGGLGLDLEVITEMWKQTIGLQVEFQQVEWATFLQDLNARKLQMYAGLGWQADYPDPQNFLDVLFHSKSELNHSGYANTEVDRLLEGARSEPDTLKRFSLYQQAEQIIINDAPWVPLWFSQEANVLIKPWVKGFRLTPLIVPNMHEVWIDKG